MVIGTWIFRLILLMISTSFLLQASRLPSGTFEPLGSATFPLVASGIVVALILIDVTGDILAARRDRTSNATPAKPDTVEWRTGLSFIGLYILFTVGFSFRLMPFAFLAGGFILSIIFVMGGRLQNWLVIVPIAGGFSWLLDFLFTSVFVIDLP